MSQQLEHDVASCSTEIQMKEQRMRNKSLCVQKVEDGKVQVLSS